MRIIYFLLVIIFTSSCKNKTEKIVDYSETDLDVTTSLYPDEITKVFSAHGGLDTWNSMQSLKFTKGEEVTTVNLKNRKSLIETPQHLIGFNGKAVWTKDKDTTVYQGNAKFYYNLMFYFYAMPFVLADNGITYNEVAPLVFEDKTYPGIKIAYESGVGESSDDEYVLYYNPDTFMMEWLSYTVTYFSKEKNDAFRFIRYSDWQKMDSGLLLPKTLNWYNVENNVPTAQRNEVEFTNVVLSNTKPDDTLFEMPDRAQIVEYL